MGVGGDLEHAAVATGGDHRRLGVEGVQLACGQLIGHHTAAFPVLDQHVEHVEFVEEHHVVLDRLLVERLQDHVAGAIGGVAGAFNGGLATRGRGHRTCAARSALRGYVRKGAPCVRARTPPR